MAQKRKPSKPKPNVEVVNVGSNNYVLFRPSDVYSGLRDKKAIHIGNLDKRNNIFNPTQAYFDLAKDLKEAIVFPSEWSLKNIPAPNLSVSLKAEAQDEAKTKAQISSATQNTSKAKVSSEHKAKKEPEELAPELKTISSQINSSFHKQISFGGTWLLYQVALKLGIMEDLMTVFANDREKTNRIFTLASYALMTNDDFDLVEEWQEDTFLLTRAYLDYQSLVRIFSSVSEEECEKFMLLRKERLPKQEKAQLCVQTNTYYEMKNGCGINGERDSSESIEFQDVVFYAIPCDKGQFLNDYDFTNKIPYYFAELPSDPFNKKPNAGHLLKVIDKVNPTNFDNFCLLTDCGFNELSDLEPLLRRGIKFQSHSYPDQEDLKRIIREEFPQPELPSSPQAPSLFDTSTDQISYQKLTHYKLRSGDNNQDCPKSPSSNEDLIREQREVCMRTTLTFSSSSQEDSLDMLNTEVEEQSEIAQEAFIYKTPIKDRSLFENDCPLIKFVYDPDTGAIKYFSHDQEKIQNQTLIAGFEGFRTFGIDAGCVEVSTLDAEYLEQEYFISQFKGKFGHNRFVGTEKEAQSGKRLVTFIALILNSYLEQKRQENDVFKIGVEPRALLAEVNKVYATQQNGKIYFAGKNITRYKQCLEALGGRLPTGVRLS